MAKKTFTPWMRFNKDLRRPINKLAARVLNNNSESMIHRYTDSTLLRNKAAKENNPIKKNKLLQMANDIEQLEKRADSRLVSDKAADKAQKAMERAKWLRDKK